MDKLSYALGARIGYQIHQDGMLTNEFNLDDFMSGVKDHLDHNLKMDFTEVEKILMTHFKKVEEHQRKVSLEKADTYLKSNAENPNVKTTQSGLQYKVISEGNGAKPGAHSHVKVHYEGKFLDGTVFDSSYQRGKPVEFGLDQVIPGWTEGLQLMSERSLYEFTIPPQLGYGETGIPGHIPGNSVLIFKVELIKVL